MKLCRQLQRRGDVAAQAQPGESSGSESDSESMLSAEEQRIASLERLTRQKRQAPRPPQRRHTEQVQCAGCLVIGHIGPFLSSRTAS